MKLILYSHGGSGNHGCEAIVRGTCKIIQKSIVPNDVVLLSYRLADDRKYLADFPVVVAPIMPECNRKSIRFFLAYLKLKLGDCYAIDKLRLRAAINQYKGASVSLSIGGDNYCYGNNAMHYYQNQYLKSLGIPIVLWGCSVEPDSLNGELAEEMKRFDLIAARESISYRALKQVNPNTVLVSDPAFCLSAKNVSLPKGFISRNTVGINASPVLLTCEIKKNAALENYRHLIQHILGHTDMAVALIPHVVWQSNNDLNVLRTLKDEFSSNRVVLIEDHPAEELKYIISQCRFFVGARTHATIAAYSTCVPTLVVGYSVKARGIATDIFGTDEHYVLPVQALNDADNLVQEFIWLMEHEKQIHCHLQSFMPEYCEKAYAAGAALKQLLGKR